MPRMLASIASMSLAALLTTTAFGQAVPLQNVTATFSQTQFGGGPWNASEMINGILSGTDGWAIADVGLATEAETAAFETVSDLSAGAVAITIKQNAEGKHLIGCFRISVTADNRALFCDGLQTDGDVSADWMVVTPCSVMVPAGMGASVREDGSILMSGVTPNSGDYVLSFLLPYSGVTGFRLEVMTDPSLPTGGPGMHPNGNFVVSEFIVNVASTDDSDQDGVTDACDRCPGFDDFADCNANGLADACELPVNGGSGADINSDGVLDDCQCIADVDGDGDTDGADLGVLLGAWGSPSGPLGDINADGSVDGSDLGILLASWGPCPAALDSDGDGVPDVDDNCPKAFNPDQADGDNDGIGDACDRG